MGMVCLLFTNILDALPPLLVGLAIDKISSGAELQSIANTLGILILVTVFLSYFRYYWRIFWGRFHHSVAADLKNRIFDRYTDLGPSFYSSNSVGQLMSLINNDVNSFRMAIGPGVLILMDAIFILFIVPPLMFSISPDWTWKTLILIPLIPFIMSRLMSSIRDTYKQQQDRFGDMSGISQEIIAGIRVIKSYAQELNQTRLFNSHSKKYELACNDVARVDSLFGPVMEIGVTSGSVILLFIGAPEVMSGAITIGSFFAFYQYIQRMVWPMTALGMGINFIQKGRGSFDRIVELLEQRHNVPDTGDLSVDRFESLEVRNLSFTYPGEEAATLKNISFSLRRGETLGLMGPIGSGKTTLVELLCRQYPVPENAVLLNGVSIERYKKQDLMQLFAVVPQDAFLFSKKVSENIALGVVDWQLEDVQAITKVVNLEQEIVDIPDGYDAYLGERGINLSGGQKQRMTLARALIRRAEVVILDDSLSAVDAGTEKNILREIRGHIGDTGAAQEKTAIIISHRLASLRWADRILILNSGELEAQGSHQELMRSSPTYQNLFHLQAERS
jgi:ATP-binding cassette, subfamily B, multidrug efflux pump